MIFLQTTLPMKQGSRIKVYFWATYYYGFQTFYIWYYSLKPLEENGKSNMFFQTGNLAQNLVSYFQRREQRDFSHKLVN